MSFKDQSKIAQETLQQRIETVRELGESDWEAYSLAKDTETGEHYIHYAYIHRDIARGVEQESFHYLLPVDSDEVLAVLFEGKQYLYPQAWQKPFLRNGPDGFYVWYDPTGEGGDKDEQLGQAMRDMLLKFKQSGKTDETDVKRLLNDIERLYKEED
ncbi:hypothetical protein [Paenibacillus turpanensis]|uniref:hypothetical protein n=1 Tax=Paenibacillus turpanensis TaxID=2689078 RepID=UPI00140A31B1|nr:hypothetical protein [Paenibacillus turpanensis]